MTENSIIHDEQQYLVQTYARPDFVLTRGEGVMLYDETGKAYQDWVAGIAVNALGYGDAGIAEVMQKQLATGIIHTSNLYHTEPHARLAKKLVENSFADRVFFTNSGAEANEGALKFARKVAYNNGLEHKTQVVTFSGAFHGRTLAALSVTPKDKYQKPFKPLMADVKVGVYNDVVSAHELISDDVAAVIVEPIQGEGGIHSATPEFLKALRQLCDEHQAILIFDEIQCGVGRTGRLWAHQHSDVTPDIMTIAKPLAAGLPIGAILTRESIASALKPGDHGSTFAGGPLVTSVAAYVIDKISQPEFLNHVTEVGAYLQERLSEVNSPLITEIRGRGLMVAVQMSVDVAPVIKLGYANGLLMVNAGTDVIRLVPPLITTKGDVDYFIDLFTQVLEQVHEQS